MLEFIAKYWLQFLLTLISGGLVFLCKKFWSMYQKERAKATDDVHKKMMDELKELIQENAEHSERQNQRMMEQINILKDGILDQQGEAFKEYCDTLLDESHTITLEEFDKCSLKHHTYNALGGNHDGDTKYSFVQAKFKNTITQV